MSGLPRVDGAIIARIIELLYDPETMPREASTIPGDTWGYTLINFCLDYLQDEVWFYDCMLRLTTDRSAELRTLVGD